MDGTTLIMSEAKAMLDRHGISVRDFATAYGATPARLLTVEEVMQVTGLGQTSVRKLINDGELRATRIDRNVRVRADVLAAFIEAHTPPG